MAESKQPYKTKAFPCALCCLTVPEVKELMERLHKHKEATEMENLKESGTLKTEKACLIHLLAQNYIVGFFFFYKICF